VRFVRIRDKHRRLVGSRVQAVKPACPGLGKDQRSVGEPDRIVQTVVSRQNAFDRRAALDHAGDVDGGTGHSGRLQRLREHGDLCGQECRETQGEGRSSHAHTLAQVSAAVVREQSTVIVTLRPLCPVNI
jgi:hypothetical protein